MANVFLLPPGLNRLEFWRNSLACAGYAQWLAHSLKMDEQEAWLTGMMQRLGEITIAQHHPRHLESIEKRPCPPGARWQRERQLVGFDEGQITAEIARRWDFPEDVVQALGACSAPVNDQAFSRLGAVVHLAGLLADMQGVNAQSLAQLPAAVVEALNLDLDALAASIPDTDAISDTSSLAG
jgi:HD-like signal output (HDOD) protein